MQTKLTIKKEVYNFLTNYDSYHLGLSTLDALRKFKTTELRKIISGRNSDYFS